MSDNANLSKDTLTAGENTTAQSSDPEESFLASEEHEKLGEIEAPEGVEEEESFLVDLNDAEKEQLTSLPGVGGAMAERIIAARPFTTIDDLASVRGFSARMVEDLRPLLTLSLVETQVAQVQETEEPAAPEAEALAEMPVESEEPQEAEGLEFPEEEIGETAAGVVEEPAPAGPIFGTEDEQKPPPREETIAVARPQPKSISSGQAAWLAIGTGLVTLILAVAFALAILAALNNGALRYASPDQVTNLDRRLSAVGDQAETIQKDLEGVRSRLDNLETLSGRMNAVESSVQELKTEIEETRTGLDLLGNDVEALGAELEGMQSQVDELQTNANRFQSFLDGLRNLLEQLPGLGSPQGK